MITVLFIHNVYGDGRKLDTSYHANRLWYLVVSWTHHHANPWWAVDLGAALVVFGVLLTSRAENYGIVI